MTPEQLQEAQKRWDAQWPPELREKVSNLIWRHLIRDSKPGHVKVSCSFNHDDGSPIIAFVFEVANELGKEVLFQTTSTVRDMIKHDGINFHIFWDAEYEKN